MAKRDKYEVVDFTSGGFFISGGNQTENYFKHKDEADEVCAALNMVECLKTRSFRRKLESLSEAVRVLDEALKEGTEDCY
jgi:hypothetical protein